jgi:hypothetical protein
MKPSRAPAWIKSWRWAWWWARYRRPPPGPPPAPADSPHPPYYGDRAQIPGRDYDTKERR